MIRAKSFKSVARKRSVGGLLALGHKRAANHRSHVIRNIARRNQIVIAPDAPVFQSGDSFAFETKDRKDLFFLPALGYVGQRMEVERIQEKVVRDNMAASLADELKSINALLLEMKPQVDQIASIKAQTDEIGPFRTETAASLTGLKNSLNALLKMHGLPPTP